MQQQVLEQREKVIAKATPKAPGKIRDIAYSYRKQGLCPIPIPLGTKKARIEWASYQKRLPTDAEMEKNFRYSCNIAIVTGAVSGNLVSVDCDTPERFNEYSAVFKRKTGRDLLRFTQVVQTGKGFQVLFRTEEPPPASVIGLYEKVDI